MGWHGHILVEMWDNIPKEILIESNTKEMKLGMVSGEFLKYFTYLASLQLNSMSLYREVPHWTESFDDLLTHIGV